MFLPALSNKVRHNTGLGIIILPADNKISHLQPLYITLPSGIIVLQRIAPFI